MDALDELRSERWHKANDKVRDLSKNKPKTKGRPKSDDKTAAAVKAAKAEASEIKNSRFALVFISDGASYGKTGEGFIRINLARPRDMVLDGMGRLKKGVDLSES